MRRSSAVIGLCLAASPLFASESHRQHGAHEHGAGELEVAVEGRSLSIHLVLPAMNVVGFEHPPRDEAQKRQVAAAITQLREGEALFQPNPEAACRLVDRAVSSALSMAEHDDHDDHGHAGAKHDDHGHDDHGHAKSSHDDHDRAKSGHDDHGHAKSGHDGHGHDDHGHAESGHDDHAHHDSGHEHDEAAHAEFEAGYLFECADAGKLTRLRVNLFEALPGTERLRARYATAAGQGAAQLGPGQPELRFGR